MFMATHTAAITTGVLVSSRAKKPGANTFTVTLNRFDDNGSWLGREQVVVDNWFPSLEGRFRYALGDQESSRACLQAAQRGRVALWPKGYNKKSELVAEWRGLEVIREGPKFAN